MKTNYTEMFYHRIMVICSYSHIHNEQKVCKNTSSFHCNPTLHVIMQQEYEKLMKNSYTEKYMQEMN